MRRTVSHALLGRDYRSAQFLKQRVVGVTMEPETVSQELLIPVERRQIISQNLVPIGAGQLRKGLPVGLDLHHEQRPVLLQDPRSSLENGQLEPFHVDLDEAQALHEM